MNYRKCTELLTFITYRMATYQKANYMFINIQLNTDLYHEALWDLLMSCKKLNCNWCLACLHHVQVKL